MFRRHTVPSIFRAQIELIFTKTAQINAAIEAIAY